MTFTCRGPRRDWPGGRITWSWEGLGDKEQSAEVPPLPAAEVPAVIGKLLAAGERGLAGRLDNLTRGCGAVLDEIITDAGPGEHAAACPRCGTAFTWRTTAPEEVT